MKSSDAPSLHELRVRETLAKAHRRECRSLEPVENTTPFDAMVAEEERMERDEHAVRAEAINKWVGWLFESGPHPAQVMQRLYTFTSQYRPELMLNMTGEEIAALFGQGRAAEQARVEMLLGRRQKDLGYRNSKTLSQKGQHTSKAYAASARGNKHRAHSVPTKLAA